MISLIVVSFIDLMNGWKLHKSNIAKFVISSSIFHASSSMTPIFSLLPVNAAQTSPYATQGTIINTPIIENSINLNIAEPKIQSICYFDIQIENSDPSRIEIGLYDDIVPQTVSNFKSLCNNEEGVGLGYKGSSIFRIISDFSVQGGNIGNTPQSLSLKSKLGQFGRAFKDKSFPIENIKILHNYKDAGVISMMKDLKNKSFQDSRFFVTLSADASWADGKYTAFGRVVKGMDIIRGLAIIPTEPPSNYPKSDIKIINSGIY